MQEIAGARGGVIRPLVMPPTLGRTQVDIGAVGARHLGRVSMVEQPAVRLALRQGRAVAGRARHIHTDVVRIVECGVRPLEEGRAGADKRSVVRNDVVIGDAAPALRPMILMEGPDARYPFARVLRARPGTVMTRDEELRPEIAEQVGEAKAQSAGGNDAWSGQGWLPSRLTQVRAAHQVSRVTNGDTRGARKEAPIAILGAVLGWLVATAVPDR